MKFEVKNRSTGSVQFTAEIQCDETESYPVKLGLAIKWGFANSADLRGADLRDAYLRGADLRGADLRDAYLRGADLRGADLRDAYLRDAYLRGAYLRGAKILSIIARAVRNDGHEFFFFDCEDGPAIKAGCRFFRSTEEYRQHITKNYPDTPKAEETEAILQFFDLRLAQTKPKE